MAYNQIAEYNAATGEITYRDMTPEEIADRDALAVQEAAEQESSQEARQEFVAACSDLAGQYQAAMDRLDQVIGASSPTNAQVIAAVRDMATIQKRTLRLVKALVNGAPG